jgi:tetratricopeptide (TPR) repeat protein
MNCEDLKKAVVGLRLSAGVISSALNSRSSNVRFHLPVSPSPLLSLLLIGLTLAACLSSASAEDKVTVRTSTGAGQAILTGQVMDWNGERLRMKASGDLREFDASKVTNVESPRLEQHIAGLKLLEAGKPDEAHAALTEAIAQEPRQWMRREILADLVRADLAREDRASAGKDFLALLESDPHTRHFKLIPLDWEVRPPSADLAAAAKGWLRSNDSDAAKLLSSSILLFDPSAGEQAADTLDRLARSADRNIFTLARAQLWRKQIARGDVPGGEIERWEDRTQDIPEPLRGGAYYLIGQGWSGRGDPERAAAAFLWLPLVYDSDAGLAASAAVAAADELSKTRRTADAVQLYREVLTRFPKTNAAARAKEQIERWSASGSGGSGDGENR